MGCRICEERRGDRRCKKQTEDKSGEEEEEERSKGHESRLGETRMPTSMCPGVEKMWSGRLCV